MKLSQILYKQHIGRLSRSLWYIQGKKTPLDLNSEKILNSLGKEILDSKDFLYIKNTTKLCDKISIPNVIKNKNHTYLYEDNDLLIEGVVQAQHITNTLIFNNKLPESIETLTTDVSENTNNLVQRIIKNSVVFDAYQELLPKMKDPNRPAFNFPRELGITNARKLSNLTKKFIQLCDCLCGPTVANTRYTVENTLISHFFVRDSQKFKFSLNMDFMLLSQKPLKPPKSQCDIYEDLPSLDPLDYSVGLKECNIPRFKSIYPFLSQQNFIHTIFILYDHTKVKNITELETTESQIISRAILKAYTAACSIASISYGSQVKDLPEPVTVQCIQSDGKAFYFSVYQLNTLNIDNKNYIQNYCWTLPKINLYETGGYVKGRPTIEGYNPEVFKRILAFYKNN